MLSTHYFCPVLKKLEFSQQIFEKYSTINFHENPFSGTRIFPCDQMDRHNKVTHFSQFCEHTIKSNCKLNSVISLNLIVAPCIFIESLQFINQRMHI